MGMCPACDNYLRQSEDAGSKKGARIFLDAITKFQQENPYRSQA
jgi:hypothetical protein